MTRRKRYLLQAFRCNGGGILAPEYFADRMAALDRADTLWASHGCEVVEVSHELAGQTRWKPISTYGAASL